MASYQGHYAKFVSMMSPKCAIVENDCKLMLIVLHSHFLPQQQYSWVLPLWFIDEDASFFHFFLQDNEHTELTVLLFFQNPYAIFAHILQHYHDFQSNATIFFSVVQAYIQPYSFSERIKLIICQIRHELSVTIHEISTGWKKNVRWRTEYKQTHIPFCIYKMATTTVYNERSLRNFSLKFFMLWQIFCLKSTERKPLKIIFQISF